MLVVLKCRLQGLDLKVCIFKYRRRSKLYTYNSVCLYLYLWLSISPSNQMIDWDITRWCWLKYLFSPLLLKFLWHSIESESARRVRRRVRTTHTHLKRFTNSSLFMKSKNNSRSDKLHHQTNFFEFNLLKIGGWRS